MAPTSEKVSGGAGKEELMKEEQRWNWEGGKSPYYARQSRKEAPRILFGCGLAFVAWLVILAVCRAVGVVS